MPPVSDSGKSRPTRRQYLALVGAAGAASLSGCPGLTGDGTNDGGNGDAGGTGNGGADGGRQNGIDGRDVATGTTRDGSAIERSATARGAAVVADVKTASRRLFAAAEAHDGLLPSILDRESGEMLATMPPTIEGLRTDDRVFPGANLADEKPLLRTWDALSTVDGDPTFADAADRYFDTFVETCTDTATGLWPMGEEAFWNLETDAVGDSQALDGDPRPVGAVHEHLGLLPEYLLEAVATRDPATLQAFADGLGWHWTDETRTHFNRHAPIEVERYAAVPGYGTDYPRHSGFYAHDWAFAYARDQRPERRANLVQMLDYWWESPLREHGLLPLESRRRNYREDRVDELLTHVTCSLGASLLDTAAILADVDSDLAATARERGRHYVLGVVDAPHDYAAGRIVGSVSRDRELRTTEPFWGSAYGDRIAATQALLCLAAARHLDGEARAIARRHAVEIGELYRTVGFPDPHRGIRARDPGTVLGLYATLYERESDEKWLTAGLDLADWVREWFLDGAPLPRGATTLDHYESTLGPEYLLHGLARVGFLARDGETRLEQDFSNR